LAHGLNANLVRKWRCDADAFIGRIAGTRMEVGVATLVLDARRLRGATSIRLHLADAAGMKALWASAVNAVPERGTTVGGKGEDGDGDCAVVIETRTRLRLPCGDCSVVIEAAPGTRVLSGCGATGKVEEKREAKGSALSRRAVNRLLALM
jgi:hypothetical protein